MSHSQRGENPSEQTDSPPPVWRTRYGIGWLVMGAIASYFLLTEHLVHLVGALPLLSLLACPLMHVFMHHRHGLHHHGNAQSETNSTKSANSRPGDSS